MCLLLSSGFHLAITIKARLVECCRDGRTFQKDNESCQSDHWVLRHLPDQGPSPRLFSLARRPALGRVLVVSKFFHLWMEATVFLGIFNAAEMFWYPSLDLCLGTILSRSSMDNSFDLMTWFLLWYCQLWVLIETGAYVQSVEFSTRGLQSSCRKISRMINGNQMHRS